VTDEQRQAARKYVEAYRDLWDAFPEADDKEVFCAFLDTAPSQEEDDQLNDWHYNTADRWLDTDRFYDAEEEIKGLKSQVQKYEDIISDLQTYAETVVARDAARTEIQEQYQARILELESENASLNKANTELRDTNAEIRKKNAALNLEKRDLQARLDALDATPPLPNEEIRRRVKQMLFKFHPDRHKDHELATEITKELNTLRLLTQQET
jgi:chromosome segregation ATPase